MSRLGPYEVHPAAEIFPLLEGDEFDGLVQDIKKNGLRDPITLNHDGTVLIDGRNRYRACEAAGADPVFNNLPARYTDLMILDFVVSANVARRHLNPGQRAVLAVELTPLYEAAIKAEEAARKRAEIEAQRSKTSPVRGESQSDEHPSSPARPPKKAVKPNDRKAAAKAAKPVGASRTTTERAKAVRRDAPDLAEKVAKGEIALDAAYKQARQRMKNEPKPEPVKAGPGRITLFTHDGKPVEYPEPKGKATFNQTRGEGISWARWSWNPVTGCLHGCNYCYARELATKDSYKPWFPAGFTPMFHTERLEAPMCTVIPDQHAQDPAWRRVFVCSMADLYGRWVPDEWIERVHEAMRQSSRWEYLLLTKFPARYVGLDLPPSAWVGTSVDEQKRVRIAEDAFRKIEGVKVKWLSLEPLKEPLEFDDLSMFDWVVIGAQTETRQPDGVVPAYAPPFEWVARIVTQAREVGCKVHLKPNLLGQLTPQLPGMQLPDEYPVDDGPDLVDQARAVAKEDR